MANISSIDSILGKIPQKYHSNIKITSFNGRRSQILYTNFVCGCISKITFEDLFKRSQLDYCNKCIPHKKEDLNFFLNKIPEKYRNNICIIGDYIGAKTKINYINYICGCNSEEILINLTKRKQFDYCLGCSQIKSYEIYLDKIPEKYRENIRFISGSGHNSIIEYTNPLCGCVEKTTFTKISQRDQLDYCKLCLLHKKFDLDYYISKINNRNIANISVIGELNGRMTQVNVTFICGHSNIFSLGYLLDHCCLCNKCNKNRFKPLDYYINKLPEKYKKNVVLDGNYNGIYSKIIYKYLCGCSVKTKLIYLLQKKELDYCINCTEHFRCVSEQEMIDNLSQHLNNIMITSGFPGNRTTIISGKCNTCNSTLEDSYFNLQQYYTRNKGQCKNCAPKSFHQKDIYNFIIGICPDSVLNSNKIIKFQNYDLRFKELDIYSESKKFAIEYNGLYFHSEKYKHDRYYHWKKTKACRDLGITLLHIWDDKYLKSPHIYKSIIKAKLGILNNNKIFARKTSVVNLDKLQIKRFFDSNHLDGNVGCITGWGLFYEGNLVQVISVRRVNKQNTKYNGFLEIAREATLIDHIVVGGESKLLAQVEKYARDNGFIGILNYVSADFGGIKNHKWKFVCEGETPVSYFYINHNSLERISRQKLQLHNGISEAEQARTMNLLRVNTNVNLIYSFRF
ncbi:hypothetical protein M0R72_01920 [Candidatus Pacearchaeota archaeon]|jgi:hypothetical protein|nr:hypothetical protein [Candidatus Pacearchaeota archaeon]